MTDSKAPNSARLWLLWVLANLAALEVAFLAMELVASSLRFGLSQIGLEPRVAALSLIPVRLAIVGVALGLAQRLIVQRGIPDVGGWPVATTVGSVLSTPLLIVIALAFQLPEPHKLTQTESLTFAALNGIATGTCIALSQMSVLSRKVKRTPVWLIAGLVGYGLGAVTTMALSIYVFLPVELNAPVTGGILGAVTGLALLRFFRCAQAPAAPDMQTARGFVRITHADLLFLIRAVRIEGARLRLAAAMGSVVVACACASGCAIATTSSSSPLPAGCTAAFGVAHVAGLLDVLGSGDSSAVAKLIVQPTHERDGLEMTPTIQDFLVQGNAHSNSDIMVHDQSGLDSFVRDSAGLRFELLGAPGANAGIGLQTGPGAWTGPAVAVGPVNWRASGPAVSAHHHQFILGGGKTLVECPSGLFARAAFSPQGFA